MHIAKQLLIAMLFFICLAVWTPLLQPIADGRLHVDVLNVGQGDAIFIQSPAGVQLLVDAGPNSGVVEQLQKIMPPGDRDIDGILISHPHSDHIGGVPAVMDAFDVGEVIDSGAYTESETSKQYQLAYEREGAIHELIRAGDVIDLGSGVRIDIYSPYEAVPDAPIAGNEVMVVGRLVYGSSSMLLTGDMENQLEMALTRSNVDLTSDVLKVAHHGSKYSTSALFLAAVQPILGVISFGQNHYGHPGPETLERLKSLNIEALETPDGSIHLVSDGSRFSVVR